MTDAPLTHTIFPPTALRPAHLDRVTQIHDATLATPREGAIRKLLAQRGGDAPSPTPEGFAYTPRTTQAAKPEGLTLFLSPHPSDVSGDFYPLLIQHLNALGGNCRQVLMTRGEKGDDRKTEHEVLEVRRTEEAISAAIVNIPTDYLTTQPLPKDGQDHFFENDFYFSDGELANCLPELTERLKEYIRDMQPRRLCIPSLYPDHPDHVTTAIAAINAVVQLREEGFFKAHGPIEIFASDPEFAMSGGQEWAVKELAKHGENPLYRHKLAIDDETGLVRPVADITHPDPTAFEFDGPLAVPLVLVTATDEMGRRALEALIQHETQICEEKAYARRIPEMPHLRGLQAAESIGDDSIHWATALYPVEISGVTGGAQSLLDYLPAGSVLDLHAKNIQSQQEQRR